eukprot:1948956-Rhodomonas_salina.5
MAEELQDKFDSHRALLDEMGNEKRSRANMLAMVSFPDHLARTPLEPTLARNPTCAPAFLSLFLRPKEHS